MFPCPNVCGIRRNLGGRTTVLVLAALLTVAAACSSNPDEPLTLPSSVANTSTTEKEPTTTSAPLASEAVPETAELAIEEQLLNTATLAIESFWTCAAQPEECDYEATVGPHVSGQYQLLNQEQLDALVSEGLQARLSEASGVHYVDSLVQDSARFQALLRVCVIDAGVLYREAEDGGADEIINDDATGRLEDLIIREDTDGNLRVHGIDLARNTSGDPSLCDDYL